MMVSTLLTATSVWAAGEITTIEKLNGVVNENAGTVTTDVAQTNNVCTLTVTPATGNYATVAGITVERVIDAGMAQAPRRAPEMSNMIEVTATDASADPSGVTTYTFQMPEGAYDVEVTVDFQSRTAITDAVITLAQTSFTFDGEAKEPAVSSVVLGSSTLTATDYSVAYTDNINAGTATVTVTGQQTYTGTASTTFTINKAALNLTASIQGWTYGQYNSEVNAPTVNGNEGQGAVTYTYKVQGADDATYTTTVPTNAGAYVVKAAVAETANFAAGTATADFTIAKADLANASVSLTGWTYGDAANTPTVTGNLGEGAVTYTYANTAAPSMEYTATVPTNAGSYSVKAAIAETTNYNGTEVTGNFAIAQANFSQVVIADIADQNYTGKAISPAVTVTYKGNAVDADEYTVAYSNNTDVGQAIVTLTTTGVNFAAGETNPSKTFQIVAAEAVITGTDQTVTYNGYDQEYTNGSVDNGVLVVTYYDSSEARAKGSNGYTQAPTNAGVYYVQLTQGDRNYTSAPVDVTFTIEAKSITADIFSISEDDMEVIFQEKAVTPEVSGWDSENQLTNDDFEVAYSNNNKVGTATITVTGKGNYQGNVELHFTILRQLNISFAQNEWASYSAAENLQLPEGLKAYVVSGVTGNTVSVSEINYIPQGVGVLLNTTEQLDSYVAAAYEGVPETVNSELRGCAEATAVASLTANNDIYVLYNDEFVKTTNGNIPAFRCYLPLAKGAAGSRLDIGFDDTTGISAIRAKNLDGSEKWYDLNGRMLNGAPAQKGLYIVNGKKVMVK